MNGEGGGAPILKDTSLSCWGRPTPRPTPAAPHSPPRPGWQHAPQGAWQRPQAQPSETAPPPPCTDYGALPVPARAEGWDEKIPPVAAPRTKRATTSLPPQQPRPTAPQRQAPRPWHPQQLGLVLQDERRLHLGRDTRRRRQHGATRPSLTTTANITTERRRSRGDAIKTTTRGTTE